MQSTLYVDVKKLCGSPLEHPVRWYVVNELKRTVTPLANNFLLESNDFLPVVTVSVTSNSYPVLLYTQTVDSVEGVRWLVRQTPNILCYLPPSNSRENGVPVCIRDKWRNEGNPKTRKPESGFRSQNPESGTGNQNPESGIRNPESTNQRKQALQTRGNYLAWLLSEKNKSSNKRTFFEIW